MNDSDGLPMMGQEDQAQELMLEGSQVNDDTPIESFEDPDAPIAEIQMPEYETPEQKHQNSIKAAFINSYNTGTPLVEGYMNSLSSPSGKGELQKQSLMKSELDTQALRKAYTEYATFSSPETMYQAAGNVNMEIDLSQVKADDVNVQFAESVTGEDYISDADTRRIATNAELQEWMGELEKNVSLGSTVSQFLSDLVPGKSTYDNYQATGSFMGQDEAINSLKAGFSKLPDDKKMASAEAIFKHLESSMPYNKAVDTMKNLLTPGEDASPYDYSAAAALTDVVGILDGAEVLYAAGKGLKKLTVRQANKMKNNGGFADKFTGAMKRAQGEAMEGIES